jgi:hypothetical protein
MLDLASLENMHSISKICTYLNEINIGVHVTLIKNCLDVKVDCFFEVALVQIL